MKLTSMIHAADWLLGLGVSVRQFVRYCCEQPPETRKGMPVLRDWDLALDADRVLWGQGANPAVIRARRPKLAELAERAIEEGRPYLAPAVLYRRISVVGLRHERLTLAGSGRLQGPLIAGRLAAASEVIVAVCTVGDGLARRISEGFRTDPVHALALEGVAAAAAEALAEAACRRFEAFGQAEGLQASIPLNPGMIGWPLEEGQPQIFSLLPSVAVEIGVSLEPSGLMQPLKSLSLVIGLGRHLDSAGQSCDYCSMRETCRHKDHGHV